MWRFLSSKTRWDLKLYKAWQIRQEMQYQLNEALSK